MAYILDLFTPETWARFCESEGKVSGFRSGQSKLAHRRVKIGDVFLCYMTRLSRWCGILEVESAPYWDDTPIYDDPDPFVVRFRVKPLVVLDPEHSIPIRHEVLWNHLSITKEHKLGSSTWTGSFRGSLRILTAEDGAYIEQCLQEQQRNPIAYALTEKEKREFEGIVKLSTEGGEVGVVAHPTDNHDDSTDEQTQGQSSKLSVQMQAKVAQIGAVMGHQVWVPKRDRTAVKELTPNGLLNSFAESLPMNYDPPTMGTIEEIDVIWLDGGYMVRAFEVEHTTAIYSGLLRMADLLALQQNIGIRLHIVAPSERREDVFKQIKRPAFARLGKRALSKECTYLSYEAVDELAGNEDLEYLNEGVVNKYAESAEDH